MSEWKEETLGSIAAPYKGAIISGPFGSNISSKYFTNYGVPVIRGNNLSLDIGIKFKDEGFVFIHEDKAEELNVWASKDDLIFTAAGTIGQVAILTGREKYYRYIISNKQLRVTLDRKRVYPLFAYYWFASPAIIDIILNCDTGSTIPLINLSVLKSLPIRIPPLPEQKAIAAVLSSLDDKIDLLHRQNRTLEAMAETLFRQWFVEEADEGWEEGKLKQYVDIGIGRTPPRQEHEWFSETETDMKWISIKDLGNDGAYIFKTAEYLTHGAVVRFNIPIIPVNTVVLSFKMTVGRVAITTEAMLSNEAIAHFKFKPDTPFTIEYLYLFLKTYQYESLGSTSSIVTAINSAMIKDMGIIVPDSNLMDRFDIAMKELFKKIRSNQQQIRTLENLRDTLLPKLMSGEVRVTL